MKKLTQYDRAVLEFARTWNSCATWGDLITTFQALGAEVAHRTAFNLRNQGVNLRLIARPEPNIKYLNRMLEAPKKPRRAKKSKRTK